jgi:hypothetical protein
MANSTTHAQLPPVYGALYTCYIGYRKSDGTSLAPTSIDTEVSTDAGTLADATNEVTLIKEVGGVTDSALGYITLTAAEMTGDQVTVQSKSSNCVTALLTIRPARIVAVRTGTAAGGAAGTITLDASASAVDDYYNGMVLRTDTLTGAGQARVVTDYNGTTKVATVLPAWETTPDATTTYTVGYLVGPAVNQSNVGAVASVTGAVGSVGTGGITAASIADNAIDAAALAADLDSYGARVEIIDDDGAGTPADRYCVTWLKNMEMLTTGVTDANIRVVKLADGADLVAETALAAVGSTGAYQYVETTNRIVDGAAYMVLVTATIAASTRTWPHFIGRDSVAA